MFEKLVLPLGKGEPEGVNPFVRRDFSNTLLLTLEDRIKHPGEGLAYWNV
jgi:hypothetical protein